jgi:hypothetical protein
MIALSKPVGRLEVQAFHVNLPSQADPSDAAAQSLPEGRPEAPKKGAPPAEKALTEKDLPLLVGPPPVPVTFKEDLELPNPALSFEKGHGSVQVRAGEPEGCWERPFRSQGVTEDNLRIAPRATAKDGKNERNVETAPLHLKVQSLPVCGVKRGKWKKGALSPLPETSGHRLFATLALPAAGVLHLAVEVGDLLITALHEEGKSLFEILLRGSFGRFRGFKALQGKIDTALLVDLDHFGPYLLLQLKDVLHFLDIAVRELGDVHHGLLARRETDEGPIGGNMFYRSCDDVTDVDRPC